MALTAELPPPVDSSPTTTGSDQVLNAKSNPSNPDKRQYATLKHTPGYEARRQIRPESTLDFGGREKPIDQESKITKDLVEQFTTSMNSTMERLIALRKEHTSDQEFKVFLKESGHSYYVELYDKIVQEKAGTNGRVHEVDKQKLKDFLSVDKGMAIAYRIKQKETQEMALAAAIVMGIDPNEPDDGLPTSSNVDMGGGGILRGPLRTAQQWLRTPTGTVHGRQKDRSTTMKRLLGTKGRTLATGAGANAVAALVGSIALGNPAGALVGITAVDAAAALKRALRRGELLKQDVSADALRTLLGDPTSKVPEKQRPDRKKIDWMKQFYRMDPEDYQVDAQGNISRRDRVARTAIGRKQLIEDLNGNASIIDKFQKADGIRPEYRRPMSIRWILEGSRNAPKGNTEAENAVLDIFNPNMGGIRDKDGNTVEIVDYLRGDDEVKHEEVVSADRPAEYQVDAQFRFKTGDSLPLGQIVPDQVDPATGNIITPGHRVVNQGETAAFDFYALRTFNPGEPLPVGTIIPGHRDPSGNWIREERVNAPGDFATFRFTTNQRFLPGQIIPAGTFLPAHRGPGNYETDNDGNRIAITVRNPHFDWDNLDIAGNAQRWMDAEEIVLRDDIKDVFQSIVDGKTDHLILFKTKLDIAREGHRSGKMVEEKRKELTREQTAITKDKATLAAEDTALTTFQKTVAEKRKEISTLERELHRTLRAVQLDGIPNATPDLIQEALQKALGEGDVTVTINGNSITSIAQEQKTLEADIRDRIKDYRKEYVDPVREALTTARGALSGAETNQARAVAQNNINMLNAQLAQAVEGARENEKEIRASQEFKDRAQAIADRRKAINDVLTKIQTIAGSLRDKRELLMSSDTEGRSNTDLTVLGLNFGFDTITGWGVASLTPDLLATTSYEDIQKQINEAYATDPTKGWPKDANTVAENRMIIIHAMAEARARKQEPTLATTPPDITSLTDIMQYGFSELDLYGLTAEEIVVEIDVRRRTNTSLASMDIARITAVKDAVGKRLGVRQRALNHIMISIDNRATKTDETLAKLTEKGIDTPQIDAIERAFTRYDKIVEKFMDQMPNDQPDVDKFLLPKKLDTSKTPPSEVFDGEKAYENIMDLLFNHKQDYNVSYKGETGPKAAFARNKVVLPQTELQKLLVQHFKLTTAVTNFEAIMKAVSKLDKKHIANFFSDVVVLELIGSKIP